MDTTMTLTHIDLFAGVGGFAAGFEQAGIQTVAHVEIDKQCQQVLRHHWPDHLILSDVCEAGAHNLPYANIISFGSPCQDLSVAGKRAGLEGSRSGLFFEAVRIINEVQPQFAIWENVPGALSSNAGRDFQAVLAQMLGADLPMPRSGRWARSGMARSGQRTLAWRVLDSQYFGLAQRRKRVFVVLDIRGDRAVQILLEPEGLRRDSPPRREAGQGTTSYAVRRAQTGSNGWGVSEELYGTLDLAESYSVAVCPPLRAAGGVTSMPTLHKNSSDLDFLITVLQPWEVQSFAFGGNNTSGPIDVATACNAAGGIGRLDFESETFIAMGVAENQRAEFRLTDYAHSLNGGGGKPGQGYPAALTTFGVRRLTPRETERLQGFEDGWTDGQTDSSRYKQMGNAVSVSVCAWLGGRIVRYAELQD
jgi:DNA (cytosine-5)-methyltransferase 1